jgi:Xaa-Pro dipeptidase
MDKLAELYPAHLDYVRQQYDRALSATGYDSVAVHGGAEHMIFLDDMPYPFKPAAHFKWWLPVNNPNCFVAYTPGQKPVLVYWQPVDYWYKPAADPEGYWTSLFDIRLVANAEEAEKHLPKKGKVAFLGEWAEHFGNWGLKEANPKPLESRLHWSRTWKTDYEVECIRRANEVSVRGHKAAEKAFRSGASEFEIHIAYLAATEHNEHQLPYGNIVAVNQNAAVLHYQHQERERSKEGNLHSFLLDAGAVVNGYASDITRTYSRERDEFQQLIDLTDEFQQQMANSVKPGLDYKEFHLEAHRHVGDVLHKMKFIDVDGEEAVKRRITSTFFPHGLGHFLGLQVHDVAGFHKDESGETIAKPEGHPYLRLTRLIEPRMVFTVEPGIYFIDSLLGELRKSDESKHVNWEKVDSFRKFGGVRIEDDILVTETGNENLTRPYFAA